MATSIASTAVQEVSDADPEIDTGRGGGSIPGGNSPTMEEFFNRFTGSSRSTRGVSVEVGETQAAVDLTGHGALRQSIPKVTKSMRDNVIQE